MAATEKEEYYIYSSYFSVGTKRTLLVLILGAIVKDIVGIGN